MPYLDHQLAHDLTFHKRRFPLPQSTTVCDRVGLQHLGHDTFLLASSEFWGHGKRQHLRGGLLRQREIASVVAMNVFGTVTTMSPDRIPSAMMANRKASVPLPTPTQNRDSQN